MEIEQRIAARVSATRERRPIAVAGWRGLVVPALILLLWQLVTWAGLFEPSQLPGPADVLAAAGELVRSGQLFPHVVASIGRVLAGFAVGTLLALGLGVAVGLSPTVDQFMTPTIQALRAIPSLAWVPLLILWMGIDEAPKITLVAIGAFFPVFANLSSGMRQADVKLIEAARAYGLRGLAFAREMLLPAALPSLLTGLRIGLAQAWLFLVAAELIAASRGLGFMLIDSQNTGRADIIMLTIAVLALLGKLTDWLLALLEGRLLRWQAPFRADR
ncbi:MAG TPA: ABC transporter permease [Roseiflexaceae bacterium]|nr:ABC transporter permease [Roseiflexaceae bacterium]